jgi:hypothetical protein
MGGSVMREYLDLYEAIWVQAVNDDINMTTKLLFNRGFDSAYELFILNCFEKNANAIVNFDSYDAAMNCITVLQNIETILYDGMIYKTEKDYYILIKDKTIYIVKDKEKYVERKDKRFDKFKAELLEYCKIRTREIEKRIRELVYKESQEWPNNKNYKAKDEEYNSILTKLKTEIEDYAKEKMKKCWYKL